MQLEALPCPFCGGPAVLTEGENGFYAHCTLCPTGTAALTREEAANAWNNRRTPSPEPTEAEVEALPWQPVEQRFYDTLGRYETPEELALGLRQSAEYFRDQEPSRYIAQPRVTADFHERAAIAIERLIAASRSRPAEAKAGKVKAPEHLSSLPWKYVASGSPSSFAATDWIEDAHGNIVVEHVGHIDGPFIVASANAALEPVAEAKAERPRYDLDELLKGHDPATNPGDVWAEPVAEAKAEPVAGDAILITPHMLNAGVEASGLRNRGWYDADSMADMVVAIFRAMMAARTSAPASPVAQQRDEVRKGIYFASKVAHASRWRILRDKCGYPIVSTWIDEAGAGETQDLADLWRRCIKEASSAEVLVINREPGEVLKGAWIELGAALACGVPVLAVGIEEFTVANDPRIQHFPHMRDVTAFLKPMINGQRFAALHSPERKDQ